jgi:hypothetical protein
MTIQQKLEDREASCGSLVYRMLGGSSAFFKAFDFTRRSDHPARIFSVEDLTAISNTREVWNHL